MQKPTKKAVDEAINFASSKLGLVLKPEQDKCIRSFLDGNDVFTCLPTGYGKSLCFGALPFVYDYLRGHKALSIILCVVPLQSLMMDQYQRFKQLGLSVEYISGIHHHKDILDKVYSGLVQLVYISPESLLTNLHWRDMLRSQVYQENLMAFVVDEAHTVKRW